MEEITYVWKDRKRNFLGLPWTFTKYALTEDRLFITTGLLRTEEDEVRLYRIMDITKSKSLWQRIFRMGTVKISSADKSMGSFELKNVKNVDEVKEKISQLVEECRDKKRVSNREFMGDDMEEQDMDD